MSDRSFDVVEQRANLAMRASPFALIVSLAMIFAGASAHAGALAALGSIGMFLSIFGTIASLRGNPWPTPRPGKLTVDESSLRLDGEVIADRSTITSGLLLPRWQKRPLLRLERRLRGPIEIEVADEGMGRDVLRELGLDASQTTARFKLMSQVFTSPGTRFLVVAGAILASVLFAAVAGALGHIGTALPLLRFVTIGLVLGVSVATRTTLTVGADGIFTSWLGKKRFIPFGEVKSVERYTDERGGRNAAEGIAVELHDKNIVKIPVGSRRSSNTQERITIILERVREAMDGFLHGESAASAALVRRGARDVKAWITDLRAIGAGAKLDHRTAPVADEALLRVLEDPGADPSARAGAAVVLRERQGDQARLRIRAVAEATAAPKIRVALEKVASEDGDAAVEEALAEVEAAENAEDRQARR